MRCHEVNYDIKGAELQLVEVELDPGWGESSTANIAAAVCKSRETQRI